MAKELSNHFDTSVELIVEDYDSLMNSKMILESSPRVNVRLMDFEVTDFNDSSFDLVYRKLQFH